MRRVAAVYGAIFKSSQAAWVAWLGWLGLNRLGLLRALNSDLDNIGIAHLLGNQVVAPSVVF